MKTLNNINIFIMAVATFTAVIILIFWIVFPPKKELKTFTEEKEIKSKNINPKVKIHAIEDDNTNDNIWR